VEKVTWESCNGKKILVADFSGLIGTTQNHEISAIVDAVYKVIATQPPKSVLLVSDVSLSSYNNESINLMRKYASQNTPYIKGSAIVGASPMHAIIVNAIRLLVGRDIRTFKDMSSARDWLVTL
jgi:hypothetical protein